MKVYPEIIKVQGFCEYKSKTKNVVIFTKEINDILFIVTWNGDTNYMSVHRWKDNNESGISFEVVTKLFLVKCSFQMELNDFNFTKDDPAVIFEGEVKNILQLFKLFSDVQIMGNDVNIPHNINENFFNDGYEYDEMTFDLTSKMLISMYNEQEEYEKSKMIWNHYVETREKNKWNNSFCEII